MVAVRLNSVLLHQGAQAAAAAAITGAIARSPSPVAHAGCKIKCIKKGFGPVHRNSRPSISKRSLCVSGCHFRAYDRSDGRRTVAVWLLLMMMVPVMMMMACTLNLR